MLYSCTMWRHATGDDNLLYNLLWAGGALLGQYYADVARSLFLLSTMLPLASRAQVPELQRRSPGAASRALSEAVSCLANLCFPTSLHPDTKCMWACACGVPCITVRG